MKKLCEQQCSHPLSPVLLGYTTYLRRTYLAYHALVVAQHDPCLHLIRQGPALVLPKHGLYK